ncbi:MAG: nucleotide exchange factor GrpE [Actinomycetota bacterium]|jgi:molecular chaperone GrpE|nr:nucleotide exchange factor GrpE [Actinomycetota bacterium]
MSGRPDHTAARWADDEAEERAAEEREAEERAGEHAAAEAGSASPQEGGGLGAAGEEDEGATILTDVAALMAQRDEYLESLQRLKADFDNYRKRVARLQEEQSARAEANLVVKLLPVLDNLDLAWAHLGPREAQGEPASEEARAIGQARAQLLDVLGKEGLERVDAVGVAFDPTVHDAVAQEPAPQETAPSSEAAPSEAAPSSEEAAEPAAGSSEVVSPHVIVVDEVLRAGYRWRSQVLRPAMVRVRG